MRPTTFKQGHPYLGRIGWTGQELDILRVEYTANAPSKLAELLPKRTPGAIVAKANLLGLHKDRIVAGHNQRIGLKKHYQEHPEAKAHLHELGFRLLNSPYHHRRKPGEYFPSEECKRQIGRTLVKTYNEHPEIKEVACRGLEKGRLSMGLGKLPTGPERKVENLLRSLGIKAIPQYQFNGFFLDFALPEQKLAILVDGCYWHCCPIHFPIAKTRTQQHNLDVDSRRERILEGVEWRVFHIWEHAVNDLTTLERLREVCVQ